MRVRILLLLLLATGLKPAFAQSLPVGLLENIDDNYRRQQLLGLDPSGRSFIIRPFVKTEDVDDDLEDELSAGYFTRSLWKSANGKSAVYALPITWQQQYNSHHPYGINDGAMISARGYQTMFSAGIAAKIGPLSIQFRPEFVFAENKKYKDVTDYTYPEAFLNTYHTYYNNIDLPSRITDGNYNKFNWGQSSIRLNFGPVSFGLSNENLWWGPGTKNSILMTNNASGFKHLTLNTIKPIQTAIGSFEAQLIGGKLQNSNAPLPQGTAYKAKYDDWRYLSAFVFTYQPKWIPNLYIGGDRSFMIYHDDMGSGFGDYLPVFLGVTKKSFETEGAQNSEDGKRRDQYFSLFTRWVMPESKAEVYFQFGRTDHSWDLRDAVLEPEHSRAYVAGFRKLLPYKQREDEFIQFGLEVTQMESSNLSSVRNAFSFYSHSQVRQGYTNKGEVIGAGIGPDNLQTLDVAWVKGLKRIGLMVERRVHNNDLYRLAFSPTKDPRRHWVDLSTVAKFDWTFDKFVVNSQLGFIRSLNYQWFYTELPGDKYWYGIKNDVNNLNLKIGLMYRL